MTATCNGDMSEPRPTESGLQYAARAIPPEAGKRPLPSPASAALLLGLALVLAACGTPRSDELWPANGVASNAAGAIGKVILPPADPPAEKPVRCHRTLGDIDCHHDDGDLSEVYPVIVPMPAN